MATTALASSGASTTACVSAGIDANAEARAGHAASAGPRPGTEASAAHSGGLSARAEHRSGLEARAEQSSDCSGVRSMEEKEDGRSREDMVEYVDQEKDEEAFGEEGGTPRAAARRSSLLMASANCGKTDGRGEARGCHRVRKC